jgi:hypothetical protein
MIDLRECRANPQTRDALSPRRLNYSEGRGGGVGWLTLGACACVLLGSPAVPLILTWFVSWCRLTVITRLSGLAFVVLPAVGVGLAIGAVRRSRRGWRPGAEHVVAWMALGFNLAWLLIYLAVGALLVTG